MGREENVTIFQDTAGNVLKRTGKIKSLASNKMGRWLVHLLFLFSFIIFI